MALSYKNKTLNEFLSLQLVLQVKLLHT